MPELRDPAPDWAAWRHQPQPGCPRCDARHDGGPVQRLLPHHRYVCIRHSYWIGPPDASQPATPLGWPLPDIVRAQRRHLRLVRRYGVAAAYDAVLTGLLICGHLWGDQPQTPVDAWHRWTVRAEVLIPSGSENTAFSASRLFAAVYPEAVAIAALIASPVWRHLAAGDAGQRQLFIAEIGLRLGRPDYQPSEGGDAIAHWMKYDSGQPPSTPHKLFCDTREYGSTRPATPTSQTSKRQDRSALWFGVNRRAGGVLLHHRHIRPVLIREWSRPMDGIDATIWASRTTSHPIEGHRSPRPAQPSDSETHRRRHMSAAQLEHAEDAIHAGPAELSSVDAAARPGLVFGSAWRREEPGVNPGRSRHCEPGPAERVMVSQILRRHDAHPLEGR